MRSILLSIMIIFSITSEASIWVKRSDLDDGSKIQFFLDKKLCTGVCVKVKRGFNKNYYKMIDETAPDFDRPVWGSRSMVESCSGEKNCKDMALAKDVEKPSDCIDGDERLSCSVDNCAQDRDPYYNAEYSEVWCNKITGYQPKPTGAKIVVEDEDKKTTYLAQEAAKKADQAAMAIASKALECGNKVISRMLLQNKPKNLSKAQVRNLVKTYKDIKNLLDTGSLESAREDILAVAINEPIVTQADKDALVAELDKCKP